MIPIKMLKMMPSALLRKLKTGRSFKASMLETMFPSLMKWFETDVIPTLDPRVQRILTGPEHKITMETSPHLQKIAKELVEVRVDPTRCTKPGLCLKCQKACSFKSFAYVWYPFLPWGNFPELVERQGRMINTHPHLCDLCGRCAEVCPEQAITITPGAGMQPVPQVEKEVVTSEIPA